MKYEELNERDKKFIEAFRKNPELMERLLNAFLILQKEGIEITEGQVNKYLYEC